MRVGHCLAAAFFVLIAAVLSAQTHARIESVAWLQGCWPLVSPQRTVEEQWMAPRAGTMLGMGRTIRDGKLLEYESVIIREENGRLAYEAHPSGQSPATFTSTTISPTAVVFENPQHDFPQKVGYNLDASGGALLGWIEGTVGGTSRRVEFPYLKAQCPR